MKKKPPRSNVHPAKRVILAATVEGLESLPSVWIEDKPTGTFFGVKVYDTDVDSAARKARELYVSIETFLKQHKAGKVQ